MSVSYLRDDDRRRIAVTLAGAVSLAELLAIVDRQADEGTWTYGLLYDARLVTKETAATPDDARQVLQHVVTRGADLGPRGPVAIVTDSPSDYAILRLYSALGERAHFTVEVFRDPGDAERWLVAATARA